MSAKLKVDTRVTVETPEGVDFQFLIAGPGKRGTAFFIDTILKVGVVLIMLFIVGAMSAAFDRFSGVGAGFLLVTWFSMSWLYGSCCEAFLNGQTLGKKTQNLRVVRTNGTPIGWYEAFGRNLLLVPDSLLFLKVIPLCTVGLVSMAATQRMQRLGDLVFDTMVIDESRDFISRAPGITRGVEQLPRSECTIRYQVPERTLAVIERLFEGDRLISDGRREEIARTVSLAVRKWLGYEEPGPDPKNPNTYFTQTPTKHTVFLKRVLKTFAEDTVDLTESDAVVDVTASRLKPRRAATTTRRKQSTDSGRQPSNAANETATDLLALEESWPESDEHSGGLPPDWRSAK